MKVTDKLHRHLLWMCVAIASGLILTGCGSSNTTDQALATQNQEKERLQSENQELAQVTADNQEVQRLKKENQDLPKARSQYQEAARLRKENEQLRQQIVKISPQAATNLPAVTAPEMTNAARGQPDKTNEVAHDDHVINEGDEIMLDPASLKKLFPDFDFERLGRKEPMGVRALLEKDGVQITNTAQLNPYGFTNFVIRRANPGGQPQAPPSPQ